MFRRRGGEYYYSRPSVWRIVAERSMIVLVALCLAGALFATGYLVCNPQLFEKLWKVMIHNMNFWVIMIVGAFYGSWRKFKNPEEFTWEELPIQILVGIIVTVGIFGAFLYWSSGLQDSEIWNGRVTMAEYYEEWTELVTYTETVYSGSGENRTSTTVTKTRHDYHGPSWNLITSNGESISLSQNTYRKYVSQFGNEKEINLSRANQVSSGDGDKYVTQWTGDAETIVPTALSHEYVNYLKASKSIHKRSGTTESYRKYLLPHPDVTGGSFGPIEFNRVLTAGVTVPQEWIKVVDKELDKALAFLGAQKQVNLLVYIVNSDRGFLHALEEDWVYGKKNELVLIVGMNEFPRVEWAGVMVFHGNETLCVKLRDAVEAKQDISDALAFSTLFLDHVKKDFRRVPMSELEHLLYDIEMPLWAIAVVWILVGMVVLVTSYFLENNSIRK